MARRARSPWFPSAEGLIPTEPAGNAELALNLPGGPELEGWIARGAPVLGLVLVALAQANTC